MSALQPLDDDFVTKNPNYCFREYLQVGAVYEEIIHDERSRIYFVWCSARFTRHRKQICCFQSMSSPYLNLNSSHSTHHQTNDDQQERILLRDLNENLLISQSSQSERKRDCCIRKFCDESPVLWAVLLFVCPHEILNFHKTSIIPFQRIWIFKKSPPKSTPSHLTSSHHVFSIFQTFEHWTFKVFHFPNPELRLDDLLLFILFANKFTAQPQRFTISKFALVRHLSTLEADEEAADSVDDGES